MTMFIVQNVTSGLGGMNVIHSSVSYLGFMEDYDKGIIDLAYAQGKMRKEVERVLLK
ncbi:hypothetical protein [Sporosarcina sp. FSL K6-1508]|uniref:hypothetical protein n=1 Tax=Sporosarcina sp. FSL K6-1508 TaxID=2921553 RepID=UPI0030FBAF0C